jgi:hypothetical protein
VAPQRKIKACLEEEEEKKEFWAGKNHRSLLHLLCVNV